VVRQHTHFFIIDDDASFGRSLQRLLNAHGYTADMFLSARLFLDQVDCDRAEEVAIVDVNMPGCDGYSLLERIRALGWSLPVVMISGQPVPRAEETARSRGALGFLHKPFGVESLLAVVGCDRAPPHE